MSETDQVICLTPTRNEAWIIRPFLKAAKTWASHIIVADQASTDGTLEALQGTPGVTPVVNDCPIYDENHRQRLLLTEARKIGGKRVLIGLDADEALSANCLETKDWQRILDAEPGTVLRFRWVNVLPGFKEAWIPPKFVALGFVDDGSEHIGQRIHSPRVPCPENAPTLDLEEIVVLHFQYVVWDRMASKQRWYQAWEYGKHQAKGPLSIFREYNHMHGSWDKSEIQPVRPEWLQDYDRLGVEFRSLMSEPITWWDREVLQMLREQSPEFYRRIAIWDKDWNAVARKLGDDSGQYSDPRSILEKTAHLLLRTTQKHRASWLTRGLERVLRINAW